MITRLLCAALAIGLWAGTLPAADAFTGSWKLDLARSTFASDNPAPRDMTLTFTIESGTVTQVLQRTDVDGTQTTTSWSAATTGGGVTFPAGQGPNGGASLRAVD